MLCSPGFKLVASASQAQGLWAHTIILSCFSNCEQHYSNIDRQMPFRLMSSSSDKPWKTAMFFSTMAEFLSIPAHKGFPLPHPQLHLLQSQQYLIVAFIVLLLIFLCALIPVCACGRACVTRCAYEGCNLLCCPLCLRQECRFLHVPGSLKCLKVLSHPPCPCRSTGLSSSHRTPPNTFVIFFFSFT